VFYISGWVYDPTLMFSEDDVPIVHWSQLLGSYW